MKDTQIKHRYPCPKCKSHNTRVAAVVFLKRLKAVKRRRRCNECDNYFATVEVLQKEHMNSVKSMEVLEAIKRLVQRLHDIVF